MRDREGESVDSHLFPSLGRLFFEDGGGESLDVLRKENAEAILRIWKLFAVYTYKKSTATDVGKKCDGTRTL